MLQRMLTARHRFTKSLARANSRYIILHEKSVMALIFFNAMITVPSPPLVVMLCSTNTYFNFVKRIEGKNNYVAGGSTVILTGISLITCLWYASFFFVSNERGTQAYSTSKTDQTVFSTTLISVVNKINLTL